MKTALLITALISCVEATSPARAEHQVSTRPDDAMPVPVHTTAGPGVYPLDVCVVSGEKLGGMGVPYDYYYEEGGKPPRLVRFCCKMCVAKFLKNPTTYLRKIDEAAASRPRPGPEGAS